MNHTYDQSPPEESLDILHMLCPKGVFLESVKRNKKKLEHNFIIFACCEHLCHGRRNSFEAIIAVRTQGKKQFFFISSFSKKNPLLSRYFFYPSGYSVAPLVYRIILKLILEKFQPAKPYSSGFPSCMYTTF